MSHCSEENCVTKIYSIGLCRSHYTKQWAVKTGYYKRDYAKNKDRKRATAKKHNKTRKFLDTKLKRNYGISLDSFEKMIEACSNRCQICGDPFKSRPPIDHDHKTGVARGLLCRRCNAGIGMFLDNPELLKSAIKYLIR
jgi:phage terminase large subunit-like protein